MRKRFFLLLLGSILPAAIAGGCGSVAVTSPGGAGGGHGGVGGGGFGEPPDAAPDYVDPGCPDAGGKKNAFTCDPFSQHDGMCPPGTGCYIYSQPPQTVCGPEVFGSTCASVGPGGQGDGCHGDQDCGAGFTCVVTGSGDQCSQLCPLQGNSGCPAGMVCQPIDVQGFGGCL
jgi:hypothetical protein